MIKVEDQPIHLYYTNLIMQIYNLKNLEDW